MLGKLFLVIIMLAASTHGAPGTERDRSVDEVRRLWELAIAAKGGRERLHGVSSLSVSNRSKILKSLFKTKEVHHEILYAFPDRFWEWDDENSPTIFQVDMSRNTVTMVSLDPRSPRTSELYLHSDMYFKLELAQLVYLVESRWVKPEPVEILERKRRSVVVRTIVNDRPVDFVVDRKTHLPSEIRHHASVVIDGQRYQTTRIFQLKDYRLVGGIQLPGTVIEVFDYRKIKSTPRLEINPEFDRHLFETVPNLKNGRSGWRAQDSTPE